MSTFEIRRGADRVHTRTDWLDSAHSFAFGSYYDPANLGFGVLQAFNCDVLQPGPGYPVHAHRDVEILTWVLAGSLTHRAEGGEPTVVPAGDLHHVSAGSGIRHTEFSTFADRPVHLVQMWLRPDCHGTPPYSARLPVGDRLPAGRPVLLASGLAVPSGAVPSGAVPSGAGPSGAGPSGADPSEQGVLRIRQRAAALSVARLPAGATVPLPATPYVHAYLTRGVVTVDPPGDTLVAGDALRVRTPEPGAEPAGLTAVQPAEVLVWHLRDEDAAAPRG